MAMDKNMLKNEIIAAFNNPDNAEQAQGQFADAIKSHILNNATVIGVYSGVIGTTVDPLGAPTIPNYTWGFDSMNGMNQDIGIGIDGLSQWATKIYNALNTLTAKAKDTTQVITLLSSPTIAIPDILDFGDMTNFTEFDQAMGRVAEKIIDTIKTAVIPVTTSVSNTPSATGSVTFGAIT